eukprot:COSAG04_NODE_760_length_10536_cov_15.103564_8_plen_195_part_00
MSECVRMSATDLGRFRARRPNVRRCRHPDHLRRLRTAAPRRDRRARAAATPDGRCRRREFRDDDKPSRGSAAGLLGLGVRVAARIRPLAVPLGLGSTRGWGKTRPGGQGGFWGALTRLLAWPILGPGLSVAQTVSGPLPARTRACAPARARAAACAGGGDAAAAAAGGGGGGGGGAGLSAARASGHAPAAPLPS